MQMHVNLYTAGYFWHENTFCGFPTGKFSLLSPTQKLAGGDPTAPQEGPGCIFSLPLTI